MYKFQYDVPMDIFLDKAKDILYRHWEELALNKDKIQLSPDKEKSCKLQDIGVLKNIVIYNENEEIVGYSVLLIQPALHYSCDTFAHVDIIYVDKQYRSSSLGARLLLATENIAKENGASVILHHAKPNVPMIIKPLEKLDYKLYEFIYGKYLGE
jgi:ribosomal protein S18 acetylase RimI-like enzyme